MALAGVSVGSGYVGVSQSGVGRVVVATFLRLISVMRVLRPFLLDFDFIFYSAYVVVTPEVLPIERWNTRFLESASACIPAHHLPVVQSLYPYIESAVRRRILECLLPWLVVYACCIADDLGKLRPGRVGKGA